MRPESTRNDCGSRNESSYPRELILVCFGKDGDGLTSTASLRADVLHENRIMQGMTEHEHVSGLSESLVELGPERPDRRLQHRVLVGVGQYDRWCPSRLIEGVAVRFHSHGAICLGVPADLAVQMQHSGPPPLLALPAEGLGIEQASRSRTGDVTNIRTAT